MAFYNAAVEHLALLATSESLTQFSWPCNEISSDCFSYKGLRNMANDFGESHDLGAPPIHWNELNHLANLNNLIMGLKITPLSVHKGESIKKYCHILQFLMEQNIGGYTSLRNLTGKILTDSTLNHLY